MTSDEMDGIADTYACDMMRVDGYDDCCIGVVERFGMQQIFCYDKRKLINRLMEDGMSEDEAEEYFDFNIIGAWVGDGTPCFITLSEQL